MTEQEHIGSVAMGDTAEKIETFWNDAALKMSSGLSDNPVQEPVAEIIAAGTPAAEILFGRDVKFYEALRTLPIGTKLYAAPQPAHGTSATERVQFLPTEDGEFNGNELSDLAAIDVDKIAKAIVLAACELDGPADPASDDTISITMNDLEAVVHRHVTAFLEDGNAVKADRRKIADLLKALGECRSNICGYSLHGSYEQAHDAVVSLFNEVQRIDKTARAAIATPTPKEESK